MPNSAYPGGSPLSSEDEAWNFLDWIQELPNDAEISVSELESPNWAKLNLHYVGPKMDSSLTPAMMEAMLALQNSVYRSFALVKYNDERASVLTDKDRQSVEINVSVSPGTTGLDIDGTAIANHMIDVLGSKMSSKEEFACAVLAIVLFFGSYGLKLILANRKDIRIRQIEAEESSSTRADEVKKTLALSAEETKRLEIVQRLARDSTRASAVEHEAAKTVEAALKSASEATSATLQGVAVTGTVANDLIATPRSSAQSVIVEGTYRILAVDGSQDDDFRARLLNNDTQEKVSASLQDQLLRGREGAVVREAFWSKKLVSMKLRARLVRGEFRNAEIVAATILEQSTSTQPSAASIRPTSG